MLVEEVGTGVGKVAFPSKASLVLFNVFGNGGEEDGSNAGNNEAVNFFLATLPCSVLVRAAGLSISLSCSLLNQ